MGPVSKRDRLSKPVTMRTVSIEGLFHPARRSAKPHAVKATVPRQQEATDRLFIHAQTQKHPDYLRFLGESYHSRFCDCNSADTPPDATRKFREGVRSSQGNQLELVHDQLVSRIDGIDADGQRIAVGGVPSDEQVEKLNAQSAALFKPLAEDTMRVQTANGQVEVVGFGKSMATYQKRVQEKTALVESLLQQLKQVDAEILAARDAIVNNQDGAVKKAVAKRDARIAEVQQHLTTAKAETLAEIEDAQRREAESTKKFNNKLKGLMEDVSYT